MRGGRVLPGPLLGLPKFGLVRDHLQDGGRVWMLIGLPHRFVRSPAACKQSLAGAPAAQVRHPPYLTGVPVRTDALLDPCLKACLLGPEPAQRTRPAAGYIRSTSRLWRHGQRTARPMTVPVRCWLGKEVGRRAAGRKKRSYLSNDIQLRIERGGLQLGTPPPVATDDQVVCNDATLIIGRRQQYRFYYGDKLRLIAKVDLRNHRSASSRTRRLQLRPLGRVRGCPAGLPPGCPD